LDIKTTEVDAASLASGNVQIIMIFIMVIQKPMASCKTDGAQQANKTKDQPLFFNKSGDVDAILQDYYC
jgi:hypothetical protein